MTKITYQLSLAFAAILLLSSCGGGGGSTPETDEGLSSSIPAPAVGAALPATEVANAAPDGPLSRFEAYRLVEQTTFGPKKAEVSRASRQGPETWINEQMVTQPTYLSDSLRKLDTQRWNEYVNAWWRQIIQSDDQLRQRVAFALSEILVVSAHDGLSSEQFGLSGYYDLLIKHAFGNYRDLLEDITLNPVMGEYLSMKQSKT